MDVVETDAANWRNVMSVNREPDFHALESNLIDVIKEEQIKLGYQRETIRFYYPIESINSLLGLELTINELKNVMAEFCSYVKPRLGEIKHSNKEARFCILIPPEGVTYVHEEIKDNNFLIEFIDVIRKHNCTIEEIQTVFQKYSDKVVYHEIKSGEFDYLLYFEDGIPDAYRYCIKFDENHASYHRFTKEDYVSNGF